MQPTRLAPTEGGFLESAEDEASEDPLDTERGRLIPTLSTDEYFVELALWFGVAPNDLDAVLPNIRRFVTQSLSAPPAGFL